MRPIEKYAWVGLGAVVLILLWQVAAWNLHPAVVASPLDTLSAMARFLTSGAFYSDHLLPSLGRIAAAILLGGSLGFGLGMLAGNFRPVRWFLEPLRFVLMSLPAVVVAILAMLWFGLGSTMVVVTVALLVSPFLYLGTVNGFDGIDPRLTALCRVYRFSPGLTLLHVTLPALLPSLLSSLSITVANGLRLSVLAEVLGVNDGIGFLVASSRTNLLTDELFALVVILFLLVVVLDLAVTTPLRRLARKSEP